MSFLKRLKDLINSFGFTKTERRIILILILIIVLGFSLKYVKFLFSSDEAFNYSKTIEEFYKGADKINNIKYGLTIKDTNLEEINLIEKETQIQDSSEQSQLEKRLKDVEDSLKNVKTKKNKKEQALEGKVININIATKEELMALPGIGETMAERIIAYRKDHNGFKKIEDIMKVKGIGKKKFEKLKKYITVN
ncbi:MAG: helix-hairpin-helix domain-containing protein [Ignavibacteria bacterium]|nr:helix-hairpin-helix domain-containing protein [Ignavibacteria bacterium]